MKKHLLTGLALLLPVVLTLMVIHFLFDFFTAPFVPFVGSILHWSAAKLGVTPSPGLDLFISRLFALILLVVLIFILGGVARWFFFRNLLLLTQKILTRIPLVKSVYQVSRDIFAALFSMDGKKAFKGPTLIPFPSQSSFAIGFEAGEIAEEIKKKAPMPLTPVFVPTAPHPISGYLLFLPEEELHKIAMSNEEAVKYLVSCGLIHPETKDHV